MQPNPVGWVSSGDEGLPRKAVMKLIVVGDGGVGKTTLIHRYLTGDYLDQRMTVGSGFATRDISVEGIIIRLAIWDFAGEERFRFLMPRYCQGALGCLLAFDLTRISTFFHLDDWLSLVRENTNNIPILLIGTKLDAVHQTSSEAKEYAETHELAGYLETSSKEGVNVTEAFDLVSNLMWNRLTTSEPQTVNTWIV
ncbi:MAG: Rab family GTPase [Candidatus Hodarchaeota archaeon]